MITVSLHFAATNEPLHVVCMLFSYSFVIWFWFLERLKRQGPMHAYAWMPSYCKMENGYPLCSYIIMLSIYTFHFAFHASLHSTCTWMIAKNHLITNCHIFILNEFNDSGMAALGRDHEIVSIIYMALWIFFRKCMDLKYMYMYSKKIKLSFQSV